jgi:hypothetical protein
MKRKTRSLIPVFGAKRTQALVPGGGSGPERAISHQKLVWGCILVLFVSGCGSPLPPGATLLPSPLQTSAPAESAMVANTALPSATLSSIPQEKLFLCQIDGPEVYLVFDAKRHHIIDWQTFLNAGFTQEQIRACGASAAYAEGPAITRLLKGSSDPVYWLENGLRRHIPDMETFRALGYREQDIAVVSDELLATWPLGEPIPPLQIVSPTPAIAATPTGQSTMTLQDALENIHNQFEIDPTRGCFELRTPYPEYHKGLQQMTALLLTDPRAQALSFAEREALFNKVAGFDGVRFIAGSDEATLVLLHTNRGYNIGCGSHYRSPDALHVVDQQGIVYDIGTEGLLIQTWWLPDRWIVLLRLKLDANTGPTRWAIWHIARANGVWQRSIEFEIVPTPHNFVTLPLRFEEGGQVVVADVDHWWADDPCEFTADFKDTYKHDDWQMRRTYQLVGTTYELVSSEVLTFTVQRKDTGEQVTINWQDYCIGPIK